MHGTERFKYFHKTFHHRCFTSCFIRFCSYTKIHRYTFKLVTNKEFKFIVLRDIKEILVVYDHANAQRGKRLGSFSDSECIPEKRHFNVYKNSVHNLAPIL